MSSLGTDGFGRSEDRPSLRRHFEVNAEHVVVAAIERLVERGACDPDLRSQVIRDMGVDPDATDPAYL
jgi:pyruvate dehydrogenase E1 component